MSFGPDYTFYKITKACFADAKAEDISIQIEEILAFAKAHLELSQEAMKKQADRKRKDIIYTINNWI